MKFIGRVKNRQLREKVVQYFRENKEAIRITPTSRTGYYHPKDEDSPGAIIRHGDKVAWFCIQAAKEFKFSTSELDLLIVASYMHDIAKATVAQGYSPIIISTDKEFIRGHQIKPSSDLIRSHAHHSARVTCNYVKDTITHGDLCVLYDVIERHMAHWYPEEYKRAPPLPETFLEKVFALADMIMSRKGIKVDF